MTIKHLESLTIGDFLAAYGTETAQIVVQKLCDTLRIQPGLTPVVKIAIEGAEEMMEQLTMVLKNEHERGR